MRIYALLLGVIFTSGYGYAAEVAVASATGPRKPAPAPAARAVPSPVWYGGVLAPVIVEARSSHRVAGTAQHVLERLAVPCTTARQLSFNTLY